MYSVIFLDIDDLWQPIVYMSKYMNGKIQQFRLSQYWTFFFSEFLFRLCFFYSFLFSTFNLYERWHSILHIFTAMIINKIQFFFLSIPLCVFVPFYGAETSVIFIYIYKQIVVYVLRNLIGCFKISHLLFICLFIYWAIFVNNKKVNVNIKIK